MNRAQAKAITEQAVDLLFATGAAEFSVNVKGFPDGEDRYGKDLLRVTIARQVPEPAAPARPGVADFLPQAPVYYGPCHDCQGPTFRDAVYKRDGVSPLCKACFEKRL